MSSQTTLSQRADYTFKYNAQHGRHGWLRLTPAYSVKLVEEILHDTPSDVHVFDPFSGTATTLLCSGYHGLQATGYELNPFLVWFGQAKTRSYSHETLLRVKEAINDIASILAHSHSQTTSQPPPIHHLERWWHEAELRFLCRLHACLEQYSPAPSPEKDLLLVVFCRLIIRLSNAAFNHQSMSFKTESADTKMLSLFEDVPDYIEIFLKESQIVVNSASENPQGTISIVQGDARHLESLENEMFDLLITSPPYPNRMSYIRELRPYMYWLGYLTNGRDAGEIDWQAIGGTWGIATSRLNEWQRSNAGFYPAYFDALLSEIASHDNKNGRVLANYIAKYFEDMWRHLTNVHRVMKPNGKIHYIVGNSVFYGVLVPVEALFKDMFDALGFRKASIRTIRKRNSKKQLFEYDISGEK